MIKYLFNIILKSEYINCFQIVIINLNVKIFLQILKKLNFKIDKNV